VVELLDRRRSFPVSRMSSACHPPCVSAASSPPTAAHATSPPSRWRRSASSAPCAWTPTTSG